jgi:nucleoside phosphorylase
MDYERGLVALKQLGQETDWYAEILPHESALLDRLHDERFYGTAPQTHQEMMRAVDQLIRDQVQMKVGHLASGPAMGISQAFTHWLKTQDRNYLALEMEAADLMGVAHEQADLRHTLVLRAISDYGDERKEELDKVGNGAMHNAIQLL